MKRYGFDRYVHSNKASHTALTGMEIWILIQICFQWYHQPPDLRRQMLFSHWHSTALSSAQCTLYLCGGGTRFYSIFMSSSMKNEICFSFLSGRQLIECTLLFSLTYRQKVSVSVVKLDAFQGWCQLA